MQHIHLESCHSTQKYLIDLYGNKPAQYLISTTSQTAGVGQRSNNWLSFENTLCFSFTLRPNDIITLTALEIAVLAVEFFKQEFQADLKLKWPNDILTHEGKKCGGIIINRSGSGDAIIGIGINLFMTNKDSSPKDFKVPFGFISNSPLSYSKEGLSSQILHFILDNRKGAEDIRNLWKQYSLHINQVVKIIDGSEEFQGNFLGIGKNGEALLQIEGKQFSIFNGSLFFDKL